MDVPHEDFSAWFIGGEINLIDAALIIIRRDPGRIRASLSQSETLHLVSCGYVPGREDLNCLAMLKAICRAIDAGIVEGVVHKFGAYTPLIIGHALFQPTDIDYGRSEVEVASLARWLRSMGKSDNPVVEYFARESQARAECTVGASIIQNPETTRDTSGLSNPMPGYLDPTNPRYAPKLAAAVKAWMALDDENLRRGKKAFTALKAWLDLNYSALGLVHEKSNLKNRIKAGQRNNTAIEEAAKVANWEPNGGASKTPG